MSTRCQMKLIPIFDPNDLSLKTDLSFSPQMIFSGNNMLALVPPWACASISVYAKSISWGWLMQVTTLSWPWPNRGYCKPWFMAKSWVEGGCYKKYSRKWGWKNEEKERTKQKWLKKSHLHIRIKKGNQQDKKKIEKLGRNKMIKMWYI